MFFARIDPAPDLMKVIECYWIIEDEDPVPREEKIIPDGFAEMIFHSGDPYRIRMEKSWEVQSPALLAGQIDKHFFLSNTGRSGIFGIKLKPTASTHLFGLNMERFTNVVVDMKSVITFDAVAIVEALTSKTSHDEKVALTNEYFRMLLKEKPIEIPPVDLAVDAVMKAHGMISVSTLTDIAGVGERQLENLFKKFVGLSPKLFARIIRFSYIFELVKENKTWSDLAYEAAFYDQSHFIRNFKNFTGENPKDYAFDKKNMANFFLRKREFR
jgi:AraC-like DNA-binding protein